MREEIKGGLIAIVLLTAGMLFGFLAIMLAKSL